MKEIEEERNESSHNGAVEIRIFDYIDCLVRVSQLKRLEQIPSDMNLDDPMAKGTYYDYLFKRKKRIVRKNQNIQISIYVLYPFINLLYVK